LTSVFPATYRDLEEINKLPVLLQILNLRCPPLVPIRLSSYFALPRCPRRRNVFMMKSPPDRRCLFSPHPVLDCPYVMPSHFLRPLIPYRSFKNPKQPSAILPLPALIAHRYLQMAFGAAWAARDPGASAQQTSAAPSPMGHVHFHEPQSSVIEFLRYPSPFPRSSTG